MDNKQTHSLQSSACPLSDESIMDRALDLSKNGFGYVEPNPAVGAVIVGNGRVLGEGWHKKFGGPHAEIEALRDAAAKGNDVHGAHIYVTLEPCCHYGKTPPCAKAIIESGIAKCTFAMSDPNPKVDGGGKKMLLDAGIEVQSGLCENKARFLNAPFIKYITEKRPWVIAKWACTLDGKIAAQDGSSEWISNEKSRAIVHQIRSRMDAIIVGAGTFIKDNPTLTARLPNNQAPARIAQRIVFGYRGTIPPDCNLLRTASDPYAGAVSFPPYSEGCFTDGFVNLLTLLGEQGATNVLVEGGGNLLGRLFDADLIDEVHAFIAPRLCGGKDAITPLEGIGIKNMSFARRLIQPEIAILDSDIYVHGRVH